MAERARMIERRRTSSTAMSLREVDEDLAEKMGELRRRRPAAFELAAAVVDLAVASPDTLQAYVAEHPAPGPDRPDEDLAAWADGARQFTRWLASEGQDVVRTEVDLREVEVPRS